MHAPYPEKPVRDLPARWNVCLLVAALALSGWPPSAEAGYFPTTPAAAASDLSAFLAGGDELHFKTSDRYLHELVFPDLTQSWEQHYRKKMLSEAAGRLSSPLYNIAFMAIALTAVIGGPFTRLGYNSRIIAGAGIAAVRAMAMKAML